MRRTNRLLLITLTVSVLAIGASTSLLIINHIAWPLPLLLAFLLLVNLISHRQTLARSELATLRRNIARQRAIDRAQHETVLRLLEHRNTHVAAPDAPGRAESPVVTPVRPKDCMTHPDEAVFHLELPNGTTEVELWIESGPYDVFEDEFTARIEQVHVAGQQILHRTKLPSMRPNTPARLAIIPCSDTHMLRVTVGHSHQSTLGLSALLAARRLVAVASHQVLPRAVFYTGPKEAEA